MRAQLWSDKVFGFISLFLMVLGGARKNLSIKLSFIFYVENGDTVSRFPFFDFVMNFEWTTISIQKNLAHNSQKLN